MKASRKNFKSGDGVPNENVPSIFGGMTGSYTSTIIGNDKTSFGT